MKYLIHLIVLFTLISSTVLAQIPAGYYDNAAGLQGYALKTALHNIIDNHNDHGYDNLYIGYETTDTDNYFENDGTILDMYSENPTGSDPYNYNHGSNQCGNYSNEGDCYNREHLFPQGFFNEASPMRSDIHFVVPSDGKVNGMRSNYPFGEVGSASWTSLNGSKKGTCVSPGYSATVFEPIDEFKGDIARCLLYFATRYEGQLSGFEPSNSNNPLDGSEDQAYEDWYVELLLNWHNNDPVSQREIDRNNAAYNYQNNRNPFIDHPEWAECIWHNNCIGTIVNPSNFAAIGTTTTQINLSWNQNTDNDDILLAYNTSSTFGTPTGTYTVGNTITGGGTVLALGDLEAFNHTGLSAQTYYYKIWSKHGTDYSSGTTTNASPLIGEPSNHVTNFIASDPTSNSLTLTWTDAVGAVLPSNYLIKANYFGSPITPPVDGVSESNGLFTKNIAQGTETVVFTGLNHNTNYIFEIFPYTNSGSNINYKTNGTVPQTSGTTTDLSAICINETFDNVPATGSSYQNITWTGNDGGTWSATSARTDQTMNGKSVCFRNYVLSPVSANGISELTVTTKYPFSDGSSTLILNINGTDVGTIPISQTQQTTTLTGLDISGDVQIKILSDGSKRAGIDDLTWKCFNSSPADDTDSEALNPTTQISGSTISSLADTEPEAVEVFSFRIEDKGTSDGKITRLINLRIYPAASNTADWTDHIHNVKLNNSSNITINTLSITDAYINMMTAPVDITDGTSQTFTLSVYLNQEAVVDGSVLSFKIDADNHGFMADTDYSEFAPVFNGGTDIVSNNFTINVEATDIVFLQQPTDTELSEAMSPSVTLKAVDENGNIDNSYNSAISLVSSGTMGGDPLTGTWNSGIASFGDIIHTAIESSVVLTATSGMFNIISNSFRIYCIPTDIIDLSAQCGHENSDISWTNPECSEEIIIVVGESSITGTPTGIYSANSLNFTDVSNPDFPGGGKVVYNGSVSPQTISGLSNGTNYYFKTFVRASELWSDGEQTNCTPVSVDFLNSQIKIYPNPVSEKLTIEFPENIKGTTINLTDLTGKVLYKKVSFKNTETMKIGNLPTGIYILKINSEELSVIKKISVQ